MIQEARRKNGFLCVRVRVEARYCSVDFTRTGIQYILLSKDKKCVKLSCR